MASIESVNSLIQSFVGFDPFFVGVALSSALGTFAAVGAVRKILVQRAVLDVPNERSSHRAPVPRGAGLALAPVIIFGDVLGYRSDRIDLTSASASAGLIAALTFIGFVDDLSSLSAKSRLAFQVISAILFVGSIFSSSSVPLIWALLVGLPFLVGVINAFNFMDGINGISGAAGLFAGLWFAIFGPDEVRLLGCSIAGAAAGFLPWNVPRAKIFLGDSGSYCLGAAIGGAAVLGGAVGGSLLMMSAPVLIYALDTSRTLVVRKRRGADLMTAHRDHVYQALADRFGHLRATGFVTVFMIAAALAAAGIESGSNMAVVGLSATGLVVVCGLYVWAGQDRFWKAGSVRG